MFHHEAFKNVNLSLLGKIPLNQLYRERAQQIRDQYDYLVLYYSGGADSHNVLRTFLDNNILLDEIAVRWPKKLIGSNIYTPNSHDKSARNFVSEWDLVISKELEWIRENYPKIKITILDYVENIPNRYFNDDIFLKQNHMHSAVNLLRMQSFTELELDPRGKKVCTIAGIDKPLIVESQNKVYMFFSDVSGSQNTTTESAILEDFYWTPSMPLLAYEMAYQVYLYFKFNELARAAMPKSYFLKLDELIRHEVMEVYYRLIKTIIYPTWDNRKFQADKPLPGFRADKDFWFYESTEFKSAVDQWQHYYDSQLSAVSNEFCSLSKTGTKTAYKPILSPLYYIGNLTD